MFKSKLRRTLAKERRTTMDSRRLDRAATAQRQPDQPESEPKSDVPRFGERPSRHGTPTLSHTRISSVTRSLPSDAYAA